MARPLKIQSETSPVSLKEMSDGEIDYITYKLLTNFASSSTGTGTLNISGTGTLIGTITDTERPDAIGTHPVGTSVTTTVTSFYQDLSYTSESGVTLPLKIDGTSVKEMANTDVQAKIVSDALTDLSTGGIGSYRLQVSAPSGGTWVSTGLTFIDRTQGGDTTYILWRKTNDSAPSTVRPLKIQTETAPDSLKEMSDTEIDSLTAILRNYIVDSGVGQYRVQATSPSGGTWVELNTVTDVRQQVSDVNYAGAVDFVGNYIGDFTGNYTRNSTRTSVGNFTGDFTGDFVGNYSRAYTRTSTRTSTRASNRNFVGNFVGNYSRAYTRTSTRASNRNFVGNFVGNYARGFTRTSTRTSTRASNRNYVGNFIRAETQFARNRFANFVGPLKYFLGPTGYTRTVFYSGRPALVYYRGPVRASTRNSFRNFAGNFAGNFVGNYARAYTRTSTRNSFRNFAGNFAGNYARAFTRTSVRNSFRNFAGDFAGNFVGDYARAFTRNSTRNSTRVSATNFTGDFTGDYTRNSTTDFQGNYVSDVNYAGLTVLGSTEVVSTTKLWIRTV